jgi:prevent-host-death family protein
MVIFGSKGDHGMRVSLDEAAEKLADLVLHAENGDEVLLTDNGRDVVRLVPISADQPLRERRRVALERALAKAKAKGLPDDGPDAAHSQDFLYDDYGLPK